LKRYIDCPIDGSREVELLFVEPKNSSPGGNEIAKGYESTLILDVGLGHNQVNRKIAGSFEGDLF
jgi:hypothetical protein